MSVKTCPPAAPTRQILTPARPALDHESLTDIEFACGLSSNNWNGGKPAPGPVACISPVYGQKRHRKSRASVPARTIVYQDSGAFSDSPRNRLTFRHALDRQRTHAARRAYRVAYRASYDLLIDEKWINGVRIKRRWSTGEAWAAIDETVAAACWLAAHRWDPCPLILSAQGVEPHQYLECVKRIADAFQPGDVLGLGGWCIIGQHRLLMPVFRDVVDLVIPFAATQNLTKHVHIWGVLYAPALAYLLAVADRYGLFISTDSTGPAVAPARGNWGMWDWIDPEYEPGDDMRLERARHVEAVRAWLTDFRALPVYRYAVALSEHRARVPVTKASQLSF